MSLIETIGYVRRDLQSLDDWCKSQNRMQQMCSSRFAFGRTHKWFGYEVILKQTPKIYQGCWDERVNRLGDRILPGWHCALLCHYFPGGYMSQHRDRKVFDPLVVSVNIGRATFCIGNEKYNLEDGQVFRFNSDIPHQLLPVMSHRWSLTFRRIKPEFLPL